MSAKNSFKSKLSDPCVVDHDDQLEATLPAAYHEVGDAIVGLAMGREIEEISLTGGVGRIRYAGDIFHEDGDDQHRMTHLVQVGAAGPGASLRQVVAGYVAEKLLREGTVPGGPAGCPAGHLDHLLLSMKLRKRLVQTPLEATNSHSDDVDKAYSRAGFLCVFKARQLISRCGQPDLARLASPMPTDEQIIAEVVLAEADASTILKTHPKKVAALGDALIYRKDHRLTGAEVSDLIGTIPVVSTLPL